MRAAEEGPPLDIIRIIFPALMAGLIAAGATVAIERFGGRLGGLLSTLPSTIVPASVGIYQQSADAEQFASAMYVMPMGMLLSALFLGLWRVVPPRLPSGWSLGRRLGVMVGVSLGAWAVAAAVVVVGTVQLVSLGLPAAVLGWGGTFLIAALGVMACRGEVPAPRGGRPVSWGALVARGVGPGVAIGVALVLVQLGGPVLGGMAAVFPVIFLTAMVALWLSQDAAVPAGAIGPMMLGSTAVAAYAVLAAWSLPALGPVLGCVVAWLGAVLGATLPAWAWLQRQGHARQS